MDVDELPNEDLRAAFAEKTDVKYVDNGKESKESL